MRVYKRKYQKDGKTLKYRRWYIDFRDANFSRQDLPAFTDKHQSEKLAEKVELLVACNQNKEPLGKELSNWLICLPKDILKNLVKYGLIDESKVNFTKPLKEHLQDFKNSIAAGSSTAQAKQVTSRAKRVINGCKFRYMNDIEPVKVERWLSQQRQDDTSKQMSNFLLAAIKQFCKWLVDNGIAKDNPLKILKELPIAEEDIIHPRRALTTDEVRRLISATIDSGDYRGIPGRERILIYLLGSEDGLRANEIRTLTVSDFDFKNKVKTVTVRAENAKNRKKRVKPLKPKTAELIKSFLSLKLPHTRAFRVPEKAYLMLKADLKRAGIPYKDEQGRYADFHSLRHTFATMLANSGIHPKTAQQLLGHSDVNTTLNTYTHSDIEAEQLAVNALPDFLAPRNDAVKATGTDSKTVENCSSACSTFLGRKNENELEKTGKLENSNYNDVLDSEHKSKIFVKAPVAQLDRASVYGTEGWGFESLQA